MKRLLRLKATQAVLVWLGSQYLMLALRTTRWVLEGGEHLIPMTEGRATVVAFWHERLALMWTLRLVFQRMDPTQRVHVLVSQHRDGRFIGSVMRRFGTDVVFGSSRRGGAAAIRTALTLLARGEHLAITPDGPRGPRRVAIPGVAQLAAMSGAPVLPCAGQTSRRRVLRSWDRMVMPLPFGRGVLVCLPPITVPRDGWQAALPEIAAALTAAAEQADRLCDA
jgi:lysophospholipid acyltransferase (LPLAT)-like uncharacterized protein